MISLGFALCLWSNQLVAEGVFSDANMSTYKKNLR